MQALCGDLSKRYFSFGLPIMEKHLTPTLQPVPINDNFPDLCHLLAIEGGKLLVSVLRDMMVDKVSLCASSEFYGCR